MGIPIELVRQLLDVVDKARVVALQSRDPIQTEKVRRVVQAAVRLCSRYAELEGLSLKDMDSRLTSKEFYEK